MKRLGKTLSAGAALGMVLAAPGPQAGEPARPPSPLAVQSTFGGAPRCEPGPERVTQMELRDGYLRARRDEVGSSHEFYFARAMYSEGGRYGVFGYGGDWLGDGGQGGRSTTRAPTAT